MGKKLFGNKKTDTDTDSIFGSDDLIKDTNNKGRRKKLKKNKPELVDFNEEGIKAPNFESLLDVNAQPTLTPFSNPTPLLFDSKKQQELLKQPIIRQQVAVRPTNSPPQLNIPDDFPELQAQLFTTPKFDIGLQQINTNLPPQPLQQIDFNTVSQSSQVNFNIPSQPPPQPDVNIVPQPTPQIDFNSFTQPSLQTDFNQLNAPVPDFAGAEFPEISNNQPALEMPDFNTNMNSALEEEHFNQPKPDINFSPQSPSSQVRCFYIH